MADYNEMLRRIEPKKTLCYNTPFERISPATDPDAFKIGSACRTKCDTIGLFLQGRRLAAKPKQAQRSKAYRKTGRNEKDFRRTW